MTAEPWASGEPDDHVSAKKRYLRDIRRFPLLEAAEEVALVRWIDEGRRAAMDLAAPELSPEQQRELRERERRGWEARSRLVSANLRYVVRVARRYAHRGRFHGLELLDLVQEGNVGLLRAADKLEPGYGSFMTFAGLWLERRIQRALVSQGRVIRIPHHVRVKLERLRLEEEWYVSEKGRQATPEELAAALEIDVGELAELRCTEVDVISLEQPVPGDDDEEMVYGDLVEDSASTAFAERFAEQQWLAKVLDGLDERSRRILEWHCGLDMTLDEIGRREGVSRERVRQIKSAALAKLRDQHAV